jgi:hypothetical protein
VVVRYREDERSEASLQDRLKGAADKAADNLQGAADKARVNVQQAAGKAGDKAGNPGEVGGGWQTTCDNWLPVVVCDTCMPLW